MKKFFLLVVVLFSMNGFSQKKVSIYNFSSYTRKIYEIRTRPTNLAATYPYCSNITPTQGGTGLLPYGSHFLENLNSLVKFPFLSTIPFGTINPMPNWTRRTSATASTVMTSSALWSSTTSNTQMLNYFDIGGVIKMGPYEPYPLNSFYQVLNTNMVVYYDRIATSAGNYEDILVFDEI